MADPGSFLGDYDDALLREFMVPIGALGTEADALVTTPAEPCSINSSSNSAPLPTLPTKAAESEVYSWLEGCTALPVQQVQQSQQSQQPPQLQLPPATTDNASTTLQPAAPLIPATSTDPLDAIDGPPAGIDLSAWLAAGASDDELDAIQAAKSPPIFQPAQHMQPLQHTQRLQPVQHTQRLQPVQQVKQRKSRKPRSSPAPKNVAHLIASTSLALPPTKQLPSNYNVHSWLDGSSGSSNQAQPMQQLQQQQQPLANHNTSTTPQADNDPLACLMPTSSVLPRIKVEESDFDVPSWLTGSSGNVNPTQPLQQLQQPQLTTQYSLATVQPAAPLIPSASTAPSIKVENPYAWLTGSSSVNSQPMQPLQQLQPLRHPSTTVATCSTGQMQQMQQPPLHLRPPLPTGAAPPAKRFAGEVDVNGMYLPPPSGAATCSTGQVKQLQPQQKMQPMQPQFAARQVPAMLQRPAAPFTGNFAPPMAQRPQPLGSYNTTNYYGNYNYNQGYGMAAINTSMPSPIGLPSSSFTPIGKPAAFPPFNQNYIMNPLPRLPPVNQPMYPSGVNGALPPVATLRPNVSCTSSSPTFADL